MEPFVRHMDEHTGRCPPAIYPGDVTDKVTLMQFRPSHKQGGAA
jgi:hypothetical protein